MSVNKTYLDLDLNNNDLLNGGVLNGTSLTDGTATLTGGTLSIRSDSSYLDLGATADDYKIQWDGSDAVHTISAGDFVFTGGNVGIGTATPAQKLEVQDGRILVDADNENYGTIELDGNRGGQIQFKDNGVNEAFIWSDDDLFIRSQTGAIHFGSNTVDSRMVLGTDGHLDINSTDLTNKLELYHDNGNAYFLTDDGSFNFLTDEGTNTDTTIQLFGKGTGVGILKVYDEDNAEALQVHSASGIGYIKTVGSAPSHLVLNDAAGDVKLPRDSQKLYFGAADDAYIEFDGNSLNITANAVTSTDTLEFGSHPVNIGEGNTGTAGSMYMATNIVGTKGSLGSDPITINSGADTAGITMFGLNSWVQVLASKDGDFYLDAGRDARLTLDAGANTRECETIYKLAGTPKWYTGLETVDDSFFIGQTVSGATPTLKIDHAGQHLHLPADSRKLYFGAGDDAYIEFDSDSMNIVANAVTSGDDLIITANAVGIAETAFTPYQYANLDLMRNQAGDSYAFRLRNINGALNDAVSIIFGVTSSDTIMGKIQAFRTASTKLDLRFHTYTGAALVEAFRIDGDGNSHIPQDSKKLYFGAGNDASLTWDSAKFIIDAGAADLAQLADQPTGGTDLAIATTKYVDDKGYIDRGDPASADWEVGDFTTDATWRDLDCSSIVPAGAKAIVFSIAVIDNAVNSNFYLRKNGNSNATNRLTVRTAVSNVAHFAQGIVACDSNRVVEYYGSNVAFTTVNVTVSGWFI